MTTSGRKGHARRRRARPEVGRRIRRVLAALSSAAAAAVTIAAGAGAIPGVETPTTYLAIDARSGDQVGDDELSDRAAGSSRSSRASRSAPSATPAPDGEAEPTSPPTETIPPATPTTDAIVVPNSASGELAVIGGSAKAAETAERTITYRVELEAGLPFAGDEVASFVHEVLGDERGWPGVSDVRFSRTDGDAELRVILASPTLTDELCAPLETGGQLSCRIEERVVLNAMRWAQGAPDYEGDLEAYRTYLVNHEVGHFLGHGHTGCPGAGEPAPVMMQQTKGVGACEVNPWPTVATD